MYRTVERARPRVFVGLAVVAALMLVSACGAGSDSKSGSEADVAAAKSQLAEYTGKISEFPVDVALTKKPAPGTKFAYLQCSSPVCGLISTLLNNAAKTMGVELVVVKAAASVSDQQAAMDTIIALKPDALLIAGIEPSGVGAQIKKLTSSGVTVTTIGILGAEKYGAQLTYNAGAAETLNGDLLAAYAVAKKGGKINAVIYRVPELSFSPKVTAAFKSKMKTLCPDCKVRTVDIPITSIGSDSPSRIVSDLQAHPESNIAVFSMMDAATGLPSAMKTAGLSITTVGLAPSPSNLQDIKKGALNAAVAVDVPVMIWTAFDATARLVTGQEITAGEKTGIPPVQVIEAKDVTADPGKGFSGYPDFVDRFKKLWNVG